MVYVYPSCKQGEHVKCPRQYAGLVKCQCACHLVIGVG
jgi:hypothetical protein